MWIVLAACSEPSSSEQVRFQGIGAVAWDRADGLLASWNPLVPADGGPVSYELEVLDLAGATVASARTTETSGAVAGLLDGEYTVRVWAEHGGARDSGDRALVQWVGANRLVLRSFVSIPGAASVWGEGDIAVIAGRASGASFHIVDISDPRAPQLLHTERRGGFVKEAKLQDGILYTQAECPCSRDSPRWEKYDKVGVRIWDIADPTAPVLLSEISSPADSIHNLWVEGDYLYLTDNGSDGFRVYDVSDPRAPFEVWHWVPPEGFVHDQAVVRDRLYVSWWRGLTVFDAKDPTALREIGTYRGTVPALHNAWPADDDRYVFTTSETAGGRVSVLDFADPQDPVLVTDIEGMSATSSSHNVHVRGQYAYTAWYTEGLVVHDISDPTRPREVGRYNTFTHGLDNPPPPDKLMTGAWGVWPYGEHVVVGDSAQGLFVFDFFPEIVQ